MQVEVVELVKRPKLSPGVIWSGEILVLARRGEKELWKTPGSTVKYRLTSEYIPGELALVTNGEKHWRQYSETKGVLQEGGRVSKNTFCTHAQVINEFFGADIAHLLNTKTTVVINDDEKNGTKQ